jgi:Circularly permutated YpsA SLOG family
MHLDRRQSDHDLVRRIAMTETSNEIAVATRLPGRVISGGQTGADQAGLIVARRFGIPTGGWMPRGWKTATGPDPRLGREFGLREHAGDYAARTAANVRDSDGTIRLAASFQTLGERCTAKWIKYYQKPSIDVDIRSPRPVAEVVAWVRENAIRVLNVAGNAQPRSRTALAHGITAFATAYLADLFRQLGHRDIAEGNE